MAGKVVKGRAAVVVGGGRGGQGCEGACRGSCGCGPSVAACGRASSSASWLQGATSSDCQGEGLRPATMTRGRTGDHMRGSVPLAGHETAPVSETSECAMVNGLSGKMLPAHPNALPIPESNIGNATGIGSGLASHIMPTSQQHRVAWHAPGNVARALFFQWGHMVSHPTEPAPPIFPFFPNALAGEDHGQMVPFPMTGGSLPSNSGPGPVATVHPPPPVPPLAAVAAPAPSYNIPSTGSKPPLSLKRKTPSASAGGPAVRVSSSRPRKGKGPNKAAAPVAAWSAGPAGVPGPAGAGSGGLHLDPSGIGGRASSSAGFIDVDSSEASDIAFNAYMLNFQKRKNKGKIV